MIVQDNTSKLLDVRGLKTVIKTRKGEVKAVDDICFHVSAGEKIALVGESGCGKSMTVRSVLGLFPGASTRVASGSIVLGDRDLRALSDAEMNEVRGGQISMVFQDPLTYLNPRMRIGAQIAEAIFLHAPKEKTGPRVRELLELVGLSAGVEKLFPHELSGGMRQRALIAIALAGRPKLLIADEPTTALDVTLQAQILDLIDRLCRDLGMALVLITHDMGVVAELCDRVYVMYAGQIVEEGRTEAIFSAPKHPYTKALLSNALSIDGPPAVLQPVRGAVPDLISPPAGCRFKPRCDSASDRCRMQPPMFSVEQVNAACWLLEERFYA